MTKEDISFAILMVYGQSIEESKLSSIARILKRSFQGDQSRPNPNKKFSSQDEPRFSRVKLLKRSGSQDGKSTCMPIG